MDEVSDSFPAVFQQQPPSPWMNQRPPLDVNIGEVDGVLVGCHILMVLN